MNYKFIPFCAFITLLISACSSYDEIMIPNKVSSIPDAQEQFILEAKTWYEQQSFGNTQTRSIEISDAIGYAKWEDATTLKLTPTTSTFIRIPLENCSVKQYNTSRFSSYGYRDLLLRKMDNNEFITDIIEIRPDTSYLKQKMLEKGLTNIESTRIIIDNNDFTGHFFVYSIGNIFRYGERRINGKVVSRLEEHSSNEN